MRLIIAGLFCFGVVTACVECAAPYFPWVNFGGVAMMAVAALIANRMDWDDERTRHGVALPDMRAPRAQ